MNIGLALSGGGVRAVAFHLGALARLARQSLLERVAFLSTVSGGSMAIALVLGCSGRAWPSSDAFLRQAVPKARHTLTSRDLKRAYLQRLRTSPLMLRRGRATILARTLQELWPSAGALSDLPDSPRWIINATCYQTGKNWRFMKERMGDYTGGYVASPRLPVAEAVAASSAVPGLIGPLKINAPEFDWFRYDGSRARHVHTPKFRTLTLWDGAVYDNLGVEALFKPDAGYRDGCDFLIVSDASARLASETRKWRAALRLLDITADQVRGLRARSVVSHLSRNPGTGAYLRIGNTEERIYREAGRPEMMGRIGKDSLTRPQAREAAGVGTTIRRLTPGEFDLLFAHGHQVADATLSAYCADRFQPIPMPHAETSSGDAGRGRASRA